MEDTEKLITPRINKGHIEKGKLLAGWEVLYFMGSWTIYALDETIC